MTRWLVIVAVLVTAGFVALIVWPSDSGSSRPRSASVARTAEAVEQPSNFTVLVDGEEIRISQQHNGSRMADLPVDQWNSSLVSHIRNLGTTEIVVFTDGSEAIIDSYIRSRMPQEIAYRADYSRE